MRLVLVLLLVAGCGGKEPLGPRCRKTKPTVVQICRPSGCVFLGEDGSWSRAPSNVPPGQDRRVCRDF